MSQTTNIFETTKQGILSCIDEVLCDYQVAALTNKDGQTKYDYIQSSSEIEFDYKPTILSPKKFFFPQEEVILDYSSDGEVEARVDVKPLVLFGIRPCDLNGIRILDEAFAESNGDPNYLQKRKNTVIIGIDCKSVCDDTAFCYKVKAHNACCGFDVMLREVDGKFLVDAATDKGESFVENYLKTVVGKQGDLEKFEQEKQRVFGKYKPFKNLDKFPEVFEENKDHPVWKEEGDRCLSCGSCIMVCPTCYCFDVSDELALNLKKGERVRRWDACMLSSFAEVSGGENFRESKVDRLHHRVDRKFNFLMKKHGRSVCVGCGRCGRACLADIGPKKIAEAIVGKEDDEVKN